MICRRDHSRVASLVFARGLAVALRRLCTAMSVVALAGLMGCGQVSTALRDPCCQRALLAALVPKLDLRWQLERARGRDSEVGARVVAGFGAFLRWQPVRYAAEVPSRFELSPSAWVSPCDLDDVTCYAELAETERALAEAVQEER